MKIISICVVLIAGFAAVRSQFVPFPEPPNVQVVICGNKVIHGREKDDAINQIRMDGCQDIRLIPYAVDYYLIYGIKIVDKDDSLKSDPARLPLDNERVDPCIPTL
jgi:hypothetical protein